MDQALPKPRDCLVLGTEVHHAPHWFLLHLQRPFLLLPPQGSQLRGSDADWGAWDTTGAIPPSSNTRLQLRGGIWLHNAPRVGRGARQVPALPAWA